MCDFESPEFEFPQFAIRLHVVERPGQPSGLYHCRDPRRRRSSRCRVLGGMQGCSSQWARSRRSLRQWDFFHSPAGTEHIFVGAGDGPCVILMTGARSGDVQVLYPVSELAARYGASVEKETSDPNEAFARFEPGPMGAPLVLGPPSLGLTSSGPGWNRTTARSFEGCRSIR